MAEIMSEEEIEELLKRMVPKPVYIFDFIADKKIDLYEITLEEVKYLLDNSDYVNRKGNDGISYYKKFDDFCIEFKNYFYFIGYPYTQDRPEIDYNYAFSYFLSREDGEISRASGSYSDWELRRLKKQKGLPMIDLDEYLAEQKKSGVINTDIFYDEVKTVDEAKKIIKNREIVINEKRIGKGYEGIMYYFEIGSFYCEYEDMFSFICYPYDTNNPMPNYEQPIELLVEKWRGRIAINKNTINKIVNYKKAYIEFIDPDGNLGRYGCIKELKLLK
jgi:hypothetical protein